MNFASIWANARWRLSCSDTGERATRRRAERATAMVMKVRSTPSSMTPRFEERPIIVKRVPAGSRAKRQTIPVIKKGPKRRNDAANQTIARSVKAIQNRENRQNFPRHPATITKQTDAQKHATIQDVPWIPWWWARRDVYEEAKACPRGQGQPPADRHNRQGEPLQGLAERSSRQHCE